MPDPWSDAQPAYGLAIDHIGIVVRELAPTVAWLRARGFRIGNGEELMGDGGPLGQVSAHCMFANGYLEISAPTLGSGNHLEPLLALGEGVRILALTSSDIVADYARLGTLAAGPPRAASRTVKLKEGDAIARFAWFPLTEVLPGTIVAMVEHLDRAVVFAPEQRDHPNGAARLADVLFGSAPALPAPALGGDPPTALLGANLPAGIAGFSVSGCGAFCDARHGFTLRGLG